jgi:hypothetical protein
MLVGLTQILQISNQHIVHHSHLIIQYLTLTTVRVFVVDFVVSIHNGFVSVDSM